MEVTLGNSFHLTYSKKGGPKLADSLILPEATRVVIIPFPSDLHPYILVGERMLGRS